MKKICFVLFSIFAMRISYSQTVMRPTIYEDSTFMRYVTDELTWSLSNRGYYIPIYTRCDSASEAKLTLSPTIYLFSSYEKRNKISGNDFRELIASSIRDKKVLEDICPNDFDYLYGRDRVLGRSAVFVCETQPQEFLEFIRSMDVFSLVSWAFNSKGEYYRSFKLFPIVAEQLLLYGILLHTDMGIETIWYIDMWKEYKAEMEYKKRNE